MPTLDSENGKSHRIVFWDLTQMDYRFPLFKEDKMLLPALMDSFRTERMKALFMGAGNADNTKAASAMADHVLFCWRSNLISKERENVIGKPISSLMLYVDRTSAVSGLSGKALYCIPVYAGDKLQIPATAKELNDYVLSPSSLKAGGDKRQIERITNMQGVA
jgi:hypothetical protein